MGLHMIRVYLDYSHIDNNKVITAISTEADELDISAVSLHYDNNKNVMGIVEGNQADKLTMFMLPPYSLDTPISELPESEIIEVTTELTARGINTTGSVTCGDLLDNICKFFNADFKSLGSIMEKDFS